MINKKSITRNIIICIVIMALILCITTIVKFIKNNNEDGLKVTFKEESILYEIDKMHWKKCEYEETDKNGNTYNWNGDYIRVDNEILRKHTIWNFLKITYITKSKEEYVFDSDEYYIEGKEGYSGELFLDDSLKKEEDGSITLIHCCREIDDSEEFHDTIAKHFVIVKNIKEIKIDVASYK